MEQTTPQPFPHINPPDEHLQLQVEAHEGAHSTVSGSTEQSSTILSEVETLLEAIPDAIFQLDMQGTIESYNVAAQSFCARILREFPQNFATVMSICHQLGGDEQEQLFAIESTPLARLLSGEALLGSVATTVSAIALDGQKMYLQISGKPLQDEQGQSCSILVVVRDVTGPHQLQQDLEETLERRLLEQLHLHELQQRVQHLSSSLAEYAYVCYIAPDGQLRREWVSDTLLSLLEYTGEELDALGWNIVQLCHPDDLPKAAARIAAMHAGVADEQEWRIIAKSGAMYWLHDICHCVKDEAAGITRIYAVAKNITERKEAEQQVWQLRQQLDVTFEAIADGIVILGCEGEILRINQAARDLACLTSQDADFTSCSLAERVAKLQMRDVHGQPLSLEQTPPYRILHGEVLEKSGTEDIQIMALDGHTLTLNIGGTPIYAADGQLLGAVLIWRDVSLRYQQERRKREALLTLLHMAESLARFPDQGDSSSRERGYNNRQEIAVEMLTLTRDLFESQLGYIVTIEAESGRFQPLAVSGRSAIERANIYERLANYHLATFFDPDQLASLQAGEALALDVKQSPALTTTLAAYGVKTVLIAPLYVSGAYPGLICIDWCDVEDVYPLHEALALLKAVGKLIALLIERERLMWERTAAEARAVAEDQVSRQQDEFLNLARHELRAPLATVKASIQITRRLLKRLKDAVAVRNNDQTIMLMRQIVDMLERGERQVTLEHRLIDDILDASYIQGQCLDLLPTLFDLTALVKRVMASAVAEDETHLIILRESATEQPLFVAADEMRIEQVLLNYINNASKYSPDDTLIELRICAFDNIVKIEVRDQGSGVPQAEQVRIWERFYQVPDRVIYSGSPGMGLGLYISRGIILQHHGQVGVDSSPTSGSTFWFTLPLAHR
ncbi:PAS domain-containing sensor histidine kinase [Dictyobacter formicarum]|uniref:histidine kinase n=1 Tax=Dictyobacter formicarum TaxID=2778368 RepID=A0ABQ3VBX1_9CHLR|nr:ATP-binding protein [Dictyobacter formicarum]GHO83652.1 hypothetical protein KSZ_16580 [Dictyobacter formicarum]